MEGKLEAVITSGIKQLDYTIEKGFSARLEEKEVTPSGDVQIVIPSSMYDGISKVIVAPIPQNYGLISYDGTKIVVS